MISDEEEVDAGTYSKGGFRTACCYFRNSTRLSKRLSARTRDGEMAYILISAS
jgi:hypothetical protein